VRLLPLFAAMIVVAQCGSNIRSKEKVQEAILKRLETRSGLDLKSLDVATTSVSFDKNVAYATVAFHPKGDSNLKSGMVMTYTLEDRGGKWVVVRVGGSHGRNVEGPVSGASNLPPGHPPVEDMSPPSVPRESETVAR